MIWASSTDELTCDLSLFILKLSDCNQVKCFAAVIADFVNFKYFCSTWMVSSPFYDFTLSSLKLCCNALSFPIRMSHSSQISITSPFCLPESDATFQVLQ